MVCHLPHLQAIKWYLKSADLGNCYAQNSLAFMYEEGIGVEKEERKAVHWYKLSGRVHIHSVLDVRNQG
jgi:TPR repeat protein